MTKVLYDHQIFTLQKYGGISRCFVELYRHMPDSCKATIALHECENVYARELDGVKPIGYQYNHFITTKHFPGKGHLHLWLDYLKQQKYYPDYNMNYSLYLLKRGKFDVFHPTFFDDYFLPYLNGKPFVLTIHDMIPWIYSDVNNPNWNWQVNQMRILAPLASAIIAVSENTKKDIIRFLGLPEEKIHVVYHGCSFPITGTGPVYSFPYVLFVGGRWYYKNFLPFVRSMLPVLKNHKDLRVVCTGSPFNQEEIAFLQENGVEDRFQHCMVKTDEELYSLYHYALGFVYPSEYEGFGIPILEAYQADCPVILNRASCFPEIAGDAALYFSSEEELTAQIERLLSMSAEDRNMLLAKQKERLSRYSWEKSARQMAEIYQSLCK